LWLIQAIQWVVSEIHSVSIMHLLKRAKQSTDALVSFACEMDSNVVSFEHAPTLLKSLLSFDSRGLLFPPLISLQFCAF